MLSEHPNIRRCRNSVRKNMSAVPMSEARRIISVHHALLNAGVQVPQPLLDTATREICMPYLSDLTAFRYLAQYRSDNPNESQWSLLFNPELSPLLPMLQLHAVAPGKVPAPASQPWKSIDRKLSQLDRDKRHCFGHSRAQLSALYSCHHKLRLYERDTASLHTEKQYLVHGDFHFKQVLLDLDTPKTWLIDLDDVCVGHIEQDIGNAIAHIITSLEFWQNSLASQHYWLKLLIVASLRQLGNTSINQHRLAFYTALALLRRAFKFITDSRYQIHCSRLDADYTRFIGQLLERPGTPIQNAQVAGR